jgi:predicted metal-dependent RNase
VVVFESFSAHADSPFLNTYVRNLANNPDSALKGVFIVHGEKKSGLDLKMELMQNLKMRGDEIVIPKIGDIFTL